MRNFYIDFFKANNNNPKVYSYKVLPNNFSSSLKVKLFNPPARRVGEFNFFYIPHTYSINSSFYSDFSYKYFLSKWKKYELKKIYNSTFRTAQIFPNFSKPYSSFNSIPVSGFKNLYFKRKNRIWLFFFTKFITTKNAFSRYFKLPSRKLTSISYFLNRKQILKKFKSRKVRTFLKRFRNYRVFKSIKGGKRVKNPKRLYFTRRNFIFKFLKFLHYTKPYRKIFNFKPIAFYIINRYFKNRKNKLIFKFFYNHSFFVDYRLKAKSYLRFFRRRKNRYFKFHHKYKAFRKFFKLRSRFFSFRRLNSLNELFYLVFKRYFKSRRFFKTSFKEINNCDFYKLRLLSTNKPLTNSLFKAVFSAFSFFKLQDYVRFRNYFSLLFATFMRLRYFFNNPALNVPLNRFNAVKFQFFNRFFSVFKIFVVFSKSFASLVTPKDLFPDFSYNQNRDLSISREKYKLLAYYKRRYLVKLFRFITFYKLVLINLVFSKHYKLFFKLKKKFIMFCYYLTKNAKSHYFFPFIFYKNFYFGFLSHFRSDIYFYASGQLTYNTTSKSIRSRTLLTSNF